MSFKVNARTVLQLGAELISSDGVAFYELIKNAIDAGSPQVDVRIIKILPFNIEGILGHQPRDQKLVKVLELADASAPGAGALLEKLASATSDKDFDRYLEDANYIEFSDSGTGMSIDELTDVYLTIGTTNRLQQRIGARGSEDDRRPILGEKGLGRLSAMRLGWKLEVRTSTSSDTHWNCLSIDWRDFDRADDIGIESITLTPRVGEIKERPSSSGTHLKISALLGDWSRSAIEHIAAEELSKLADPFEPTQYPVIVRYNRDVIPVPSLDRLLFEVAHATVTAEFRVDPEPSLTGSVDYRLRGESLDIELGAEEVLAAANLNSLETLKRLGPFSVELYWFNRQLLSAIPGLLGRQEVIRLQQRWAGGLMLYRDGFRVFPYGSPDDDWLDLDRKALASTGYKVNRRQIIGRVSISSDQNPALVDQTNREGLRQSPEKQALVLLLKHLLEGQFRAFLNAVDKKSALELSTIERKVGHERAEINRTLGQIKKKYPQVQPLLANIALSVRRLTGVMRDVRELTSSLEEQRRQLVHLAGVGLMVEIVAHELGRATQHALRAIPRLSKGGAQGGASVLVLEQQLKTLEKRLRILDPLASTARQVKEQFDLIGWTKEILDTHADQFARHQIVLSLSVVPRPGERWPVKAVRGMVVQILENLVSNSVYWLSRRTAVEGAAFKPVITVVLDKANQQIRFSDNGPGIRKNNSQRIFEPFVTTRPAGEGKGLGLYVARELAAYHGWDLTISNASDRPDGRLSTFIIDVTSER